MSEQEKPVSPVWKPTFIKPSSRWKDKNKPTETKDIYTVFGVGNTKHRHQHYPVTVVFHDSRGHLWCKTIGNFLNTMEEVIE